MQLDKRLTSCQQKTQKGISDYLPKQIVCKKVSALDIIKHTKRAVKKRKKSYNVALTFC